MLWILSSNVIDFYQLVFKDKALKVKFQPQNITKIQKLCEEKGRF